MQYEVQIGTLTGLRTATLALPTTVVNVTQVEPPGPKGIDLEVSGTLKEHGLGDYEDLHGLHIPKLRELWTDVGRLSPGAAIAFLEQKKTDEAGRFTERPLRWPGEPHNFSSSGRA